MLGILGGQLVFVGLEDSIVVAASALHRDAPAFSNCGGPSSFFCVPLRATSTVSHDKIGQRAIVSRVVQL